MTTLKTKILQVVTGEGGSGGAMSQDEGDHIAI
jgi:acetyl-CoA carboxylase alpha subunit